MDHYEIEMSKTSKRTYSRYSLEAAQLLGKQIQLGRKLNKLTAQDLADRAGISRGLLQRIEKGDPKCELGVALEAAALVGVKLFSSEDGSLTEPLKHIENSLALLPKSIRKSAQVIDDDF
jgi:transcriptional regulator with XRE-family HTH domain